MNNDSLNIFKNYIHSRTLIGEGSPGPLERLRNNIILKFPGAKYTTKYSQIEVEKYITDQADAAFNEFSGAVIGGLKAKGKPITGKDIKHWFTTITTITPGNNDTLESIPDGRVYTSQESKNVIHTVMDTHIRLLKGGTVDDTEVLRNIDSVILSHQVLDTNTFKQNVINVQYNTRLINYIVKYLSVPKLKNNISIQTDIRTLSASIKLPNIITGIANTPLGSRYNLVTGPSTIKDWRDIIKLAIANPSPISGKEIITKYIDNGTLNPVDLLRKISQSFINYIFLYDLIIDVIDNPKL